jgi:hypothetical protein
MLPKPDLNFQKTEVGTLTSKSDLRRTANCDQTHNIDWYDSGHT